jgi:hypothetical protein
VPKAVARSASVLEGVDREVLCCLKAGSGLVAARADARIDERDAHEHRERARLEDILVAPDDALGSDEVKRARAGTRERKSQVRYDTPFGYLATQHDGPAAGER